MKKLSIFCFFIFLGCYSTMHAQPAKEGLCSILKKLESNAYNNFKNTTAVTDPNAKLRYSQRSNVEFPGFKDPAVVRTASTTEYFTLMNSFKSETAARQKTEEVKNKMAKCLSSYTLKKNTTDKLSPPSSKLLVKYEFSRKKKPGVPSPKFIIQLEDFLGNKEYFLSFNVVGTGKNEPLENYETVEWPIFPDEGFNETNKKSVPSKLAKQLLELLDYAKDGFKSIRAEKTDTKKYTDPWTTSVTNHYKTNYTLDGALKNKIEELYPNEKYMETPDCSFVALFSEDLTKAKGEDLYNKLSTQIKQEFAGDFETKEYKDERSGGGYFKFMSVKRKDDKKHYITIDISYSPAIGVTFPESAIVNISVK